MEVLLALTLTLHAFHAFSTTTLSICCASRVELTTWNTLIVGVESIRSHGVTGTTTTNSLRETSVWNKDTFEGVGIWIGNEPDNKWQKWESDGHLSAGAASGSHEYFTSMWLARGHTTGQQWPGGQGIGQFLYTKYTHQLDYPLQLHTLARKDSYPDQVADWKQGKARRGGHNSDLEDLREGSWQQQRSGTPEMKKMKLMWKLTNLLNSSRNTNTLGVETGGEGRCAVVMSGAPIADSRSCDTLSVRYPCRSSLDTLTLTISAEQRLTTFGGTLGSNFGRN